MNCHMTIPIGFLMFLPSPALLSKNHIQIANIFGNHRSCIPPERYRDSLCLENPRVVYIKPSPSPSRDVCLCSRIRTLGMPFPSPLEENYCYFRIISNFSLESTVGTCKENLHSSVC